MPPSFSANHMIAVTGFLDCRVPFTTFTAPTIPKPSRNYMGKVCSSKLDAAFTSSPPRDCYARSFKNPMLFPIDI